MRYLVVAVMLMFSQLSLSATTCAQPVKYLTEGTPAVCNGYLFSPEKEQDVRLKIDQFETMEKIVKKQDDLINVLNQRIDLAHSQNLHLEQLFQDRKNTEWYINIGFFVGGVVLTAFIAANVNK